MHKTFRNKTAVVLRHVLFEGLGALAYSLYKRNYQIIYLDVGVDDFDIAYLNADLMIILGGPISIYEEEHYPFLREEVEFIRRRLNLKLPTLGICLGAQLIAKACGAEVRPLGQIEIGFSSISIVENAANSIFNSTHHNMVVLHWHGDTFELPPKASLLASTKVCLNQAFSIGRHTIGLQFHLEIDCRYIEQWLIGHALELSNARIDPNLIRSQAQEYGAQIYQYTENILGAWLDSLNIR